MIPQSAKDQLIALNNAGVLGFGQEFGVTKSHEPAGEDNIPCVEVDARTGEPTGREAINPYTGVPYAASKRPYYMYECYSRCDSGD